MRIPIKEVLAAGGVTLLLLISLSIYSMALLWERWRFFREAHLGLDNFLERLRLALAKGDMTEVLSICKHYKGPAAEVVAAALVGPSHQDERKRSTERSLERHLARLEQGLVVLGTIGSVAPFIGLFGTVVGVMRAFKDLAGAAGAGPGVVAVGISEALIATAAGLFVAIPAIVGYNYFTSRASAVADELRWITDEILDHLTEKGRGAQ